MASDRPASTTAAAAPSSVPAPSPFAHWSVGLALVLLPLLLYARSLGYGLMGLDDTLYFQNNPLLHGGAWAGLKELWTRPYFDDYAPITQTTIWLDLALQHHGSFLLIRLQQLLWLGLCSLAVYQLMRRVSGHPGIGAAVAVLYALHPVCAESALWLAERKNLVAVALTLWSIERHIAWRQGAGRGALACSILLCPVALLAKAHAVIIPAVLSCYEAFQVRGAWVRRALAVAPTGALSLAFVVLCMARIHLYQSHDAMQVGGSLHASLLCDGAIIARYLAHAVFPQHLSLFYAVIEDPHRWAVLLAWWLLVLAIVAASIAVARDRRLLLFAWAAAACSILPAINIKPLPLPMSDHYLQWPLPWLLLILAFTVEQLIRSARPVNWRTSTRGITIIYAVFFLLLSIARVPQFSSQLNLARAAIRAQSDCAIGWAMYCFAQEHDAIPPDTREAGSAGIVALRCSDYKRIFYQYLFSCAVEGTIECRRVYGEREANRLLSKALALMNPQSQHYARGTILYLEERYGEAASVLQELENPPLRAAAHAIGMRCIEQGREPWDFPQTYDPDTLRDPNLTNSRDNFSFGVLSLLSASYCRIGNLPAAFDLGALLVNMDSHSTQALSVYVDACQHLGRVQSAKQAWLRLQASDTAGTH